MKDCAILVLSCDKYSDLWDPFFDLFKRYWKDCPFPVYLGSNTKKYSDGSIKTILSGSPKDWSTDLLNILDKIREEFLFIWLDDFFPATAIDTKRFYDCFDFMKTKNANHIHFSPDIRPDGITSNPLFGYYEKGAPYRVIVEGFWRKIHLKKILIPGEDPWNFEIMGSYRSKYFDGYYTYMQSLFDFIRVVEKGRISRKAYRFCLNHNVALNFKKRSLFSIRDQVISSSQSFLFSFIKRIPWKTRLLIMNTLRKILISY